MFVIPGAERILLTGKTGQVGWELERLLDSRNVITALDRSQLDLARPEKAREIIRALQPQVIINAAAYTAVDRAEKEPEIALQVNAGAIAVLAEEAQRSGAMLIHYSSDYVFDGNKPSPYLETDATRPLSVYGESKLAGEETIRRSGCFHLILRTTWVYSDRGKNFLRTIFQLAQEKPELRVVNDQRGAPTCAHDLALATIKAIATAPRSARETYHMTAQGETTWFGFAGRIMEELDRRERKRAALKSIPSAEYPTPAKRPLNSVLCNAKLKRELEIQLPPWQDSAEKVLRRLEA